ncbi:MAG TPA: hypothetical protein PKD79_02790 [Candidatus Doudnabacteria bacterium]|nr:hypothetical protein [Candidatus Doudnabacteria bacterium]
MSKKRKKKFQTNFGKPKSVTGERNQGMAISSSARVSQLATPVSSSSFEDSSPAVFAKPVSRMNTATNSAYASVAGEYQVIRGDIVKVLIVNGLLFAIVILMYFLNQSNGFLDAWFDRVF